jgi:UDP-2,3-diacylglucosamine hydrolase
MRCTVVSDVHLDPTPAGADRHRRFIAFLRSLPHHPGHRLVLLGDIFDFWFEYRHVVFSAYFDVLRALADLREAGVAIDFVRGNHDFWAGRFLEGTLAIGVHDRLTLEVGGRRVLFVHGDGINPRDRTYRVYKGIARFPLVVALFRLLHPDWAMRLALGVSRGSRAMSTPADPSQGAEVQPLRDWAAAALERGEADVVVLGHSHYPVFETDLPPGGGVYVNTGDWVRHRTYAVIDAAGPRLERWQPVAGAEVPARRQADERQ